MSTPSRRSDKKPVLRGSFHTVITVIVGPDEATYMVHDTLLCACSRFFQAACTGQFKEAHEHSVRLPEIEPAHFESFLIWLYTQSLTHVTQRDVDRHYQALFQLYFLGEALQVRLLKNAVIDATIALELSSAFVPCADQVRLVFEQTPRANPLRRLLVDMHAWDVDPKFLIQNEDRFGKDFLLDLAIVSMDFLDRPPRTQPPYATDSRGYHEKS